MKLNLFLATSLFSAFGSAQSSTDVCADKIRTVMTSAPTIQVNVVLLEKESGSDVYSVELDEEGTVHSSKIRCYDDQNLSLEILEGFIY